MFHLLSKEKPLLFPWSEIIHDRTANGMDPIPANQQLGFLNVPQRGKFPKTQICVEQILISWLTSRHIGCSWQWGCNDNDMWLGFLGGAGTGDMTRGTISNIFQGNVRLFSQDQHAPTSFKRCGKLYDKENKLQRPLEATQINGWREKWMGPNQSHEKNASEADS